MASRKLVAHRNALVLAGALICPSAGCASPTGLDPAGAGTSSEPSVHRRDQDVADVYAIQVDEDAVARLGLDCDEVGREVAEILFMHGGPLADALADATLEVDGRMIRVADVCTLTRVRMDEAAMRRALSASPRRLSASGAAARIGYPEIIDPALLNDSTHTN